MSRNVYLDVYRVIKPIEVNSTAICQVGDILTVDEDGYDGANVDDLTQGWGFKCMADYDCVQLITKRTLTWDEYMALTHGTQAIKEKFISTL